MAISIYYSYRTFIHNNITYRHVTIIRPIPLSVSNYFCDSRRAECTTNDCCLLYGPVVVTHRTPLVVVVDLHTSLVVVGSVHQPHWVLVWGNGGANGTGVVGVGAGASVAPARVGTVEDALL